MNYNHQRPHLEFKDSDRKVDKSAADGLSEKDRALILDAAKTGGGWGPNRIEAHLRRRHGVTVSVAAIRAVLAK